jgi:DNA replication and repair protein RecF
VYLQQIHLRHFRNYLDQQVDFLAAKTILVGSNAQGKSNLLEAVELLASLRSHRTARDRDLVQDDHESGKITAILERESGCLDLGLTLRSSGRRTLEVNTEPLRRHLDFLGNLNAVQFSSLDLDLVRGGPGERRNWLDGVLVQLEPVYAQLLQQYHQVLRQRNAFLKQQAGATTRDPDQLTLWNQQLAVAGTQLTRRRSRLVTRLAPLAEHWHQAISGRGEGLQVIYAPNVSPPAGMDEAAQPLAMYQSFLEKIQQKAIAEFQQATTLVGPHRDEVELIINQTPARQYGSQGQQRTLVLALKLAELKLIEEVIGEPPLLLLDDVLAELDLQRQNHLLETIQDRFQTLITTTHLGAFDAQWLKSAQILTVDAGEIQETGRS